MRVPVVYCVYEREREIIIKINKKEQNTRTVHFRGIG